MSERWAVILVVGLCRSLIGPHTPRLARLARTGSLHRIRPVFPAVTCSVQSSFLTGRPVGGPLGHHVPANGWYDRDLAEVHFWKQSNRLVRGPKIWDSLRQRDPALTTANVCWWFNMNTTADFTLTPRPIYRADGRKIPDCYTTPADLRERLQSELGAFPLFHFWGPTASIHSSRWIADAALRIDDWHKPTLGLVYLPHLDYDLQRFGPPAPADLTAAGVSASAVTAPPRSLHEIDSLLDRLLDEYARRNVRTILLSEYGIEPVTASIPINRVLRSAGSLRVRRELDAELLDPAASDAFAVADHQCAHVYVRDPDRIAHVADLCRGTPGVERVLDRREQQALRIDTPRSGELLLVAAPGRWFSYPWWTDDRHAPDYARTVDIHRKPGYDPLELLLDPAKPFIKPRIAAKLAARRLGFRNLLDVIPLDESLVRGSHGRTDTHPDLQPVLLFPPDAPSFTQSLPDPIDCTAVHDILLRAILGPAPT